MRILAFFWLVIVSFMTSQAAIAAQSSWLETDFVKMRLLSASQTAGTSGIVSLGLEMRLESGWKTYWRSPGDAGLPPRIMLDDSYMAGAKAELFHPLPKRFSLFGLDTFGYGERVVFPIDLHLADIAQAGTISMMVEALVCSDICVPIQGALSLSLPQGSHEPSPHSQELAKWRSQLPPSDPDALALYQISANNGDDNGRRQIAVVLAEPAQVHDIIIEAPAGFSFAPPEKQSDTRYLIRQIAGEPPLAIGQIVTVTVDAEQRAFQTRGAIGGVRSTPLANQTSASLPYWLIALIGGFILNFMPCVLPVLSLKVASVLSLSGLSGRHIRLRFMASASGIITSFVMIAVFLQMIRLAGGQIGWGIQFQLPLFLAVMVAVTALFTLSLFDVIALRTPGFVAAILPPRNADKGHGLWHDFGAGMLATLLATPCSAPFVGTAVGFALSQSDLALYGIMVMMGIGLALPWLILAIFPQLVSALPRPGSWMTGLKKLLGVLMALTVLWLASLFYNAVAQPRSQLAGAADTQWQIFDEAALDQMRAKEALIFVDVTADWCLTCKANKALVLDTASANALFEEHNVILLRADWTRPDAAIARFLASYERFGIPFNIVYGPGAKGGLILPEIFTLSDLKKALEAANQSR